MDNIPTEEQNSKYCKKYKYMKKRTKSLIFENAALCDEVARIQESIQIVKDERKFLLRKLLEYENDPDQYSFKNGSNYTHDSKKAKKRRSHEDCVKGIMTQNITM